MPIENQTHYLKFNGVKYYRFNTGYTYKLKAKQDAEYWRKRGYKIRLIQDKDGKYSLYRRHGT